jgi:hypothetical protein
VGAVFALYIDIQCILPFDSPEKYTGLAQKNTADKNSGT